LLASYRQPSIFLQVIGGVPGASITAEREGAAAEPGGLEKFSSQDDFKSYLDSGCRATAAGPFEAEKAALTAKEEEPAKVKPAGKTSAPAVAGIAPEDAKKFFHWAKRPQKAPAISSGWTGKSFIFASKSVLLAGVCRRFAPGGRNQNF
jgi:hypothetical protein